MRYMWAAGSPPPKVVYQVHIYCAPDHHGKLSPQHPARIK